jgi:hypothetical protein
MTMGAAVADAGAAGGGAAVEDAACGLPPQAARMGSKSASSSSGEKMFHRVGGSSGYSFQSVHVCKQRPRPEGRDSYAQPGIPTQRGSRIVFVAESWKSKWLRTQSS